MRGKKWIPLRILEICFWVPEVPWLVHPNSTPHLMILKSFLKMTFVNHSAFLFFSIPDESTNQEQRRKKKDITKNIIWLENTQLFFWQMPDSTWPWRRRSWCHFFFLPWNCLCFPWLVPQLGCFFPRTFALISLKRQHHLKEAKIKKIRGAYS